jgi:hypothetical protein
MIEVMLAVKGRAGILQNQFTGFVQLVKEGVLTTRQSRARAVFTDSLTALWSSIGKVPGKAASRRCTLALIVSS